MYGRTHVKLEPVDVGDEEGGGGGGSNHRTGYAKTVMELGRRQCHCCTEYSEAEKRRAQKWKIGSDIRTRTTSLLLGRYIACRVSYFIFQENSSTPNADD